MTRGQGGWSHDLTGQAVMKTQWHSKGGRGNGKWPTKGERVNSWGSRQLPGNTSSHGELLTLQTPRSKTTHCGTYRNGKWPKTCTSCLAAIMAHYPRNKLGLWATHKHQTQTHAKNMADYTNPHTATNGQEQWSEWPGPEDRCILGDGEGQAVVGSDFLKRGGLSD